MKPTIRRLAVITVPVGILVALAGAGFTLARGGPLFTITEDINPQNLSVLVTVGNSSEKPASGAVEVRAWFNGVPVRRAEPVTVEGFGTEVVEVYFGPGLTEVIETAIIEDPDPIPA